jgi:5-methylcytosine-specific restriction endonuclease McrA
MTYKELLKDPRWQKKRLEVFERAGWKCEWCGAKDNTLHIHHKYYDFQLKPWEYPSESLACLCEDCHWEFNMRLKSIKEMMGKLDLGNICMLQIRCGELLEQQKYQQPLERDE